MRLIDTISPLIMNEQRILREQEHFDKLAEETGEIWWGSTTPAGQMRKQRRADLILDSLQAFADPLVLELGCGTGALTQYLLQKRPQLSLIGLDISPQCVTEAIRRFPSFPQTEFQVANAYELPLRDQAADAVVGASVIHHLDVDKALRECYRVLKPGGLIWFSEPNMMNPQVAIEKNIHSIGRLLQNSDDETAFFRWSLAARLRQTGFEQVQVKPYDFLHPIIPKRLISVVNRLGLWLESIPIIKEISGSLIVQARKPSNG